MESSPRSPRTFTLVAVHITALVVARVLPWILAILLMLAIKDAAYAVSGQSSFIGVWRELTGNIKVSRGFALVFGAFGIWYGLQQRNLRRSEQERAERERPSGKAVL